MDLLTFISDQTIYLLSVALPDANPKQIRLLLLSCVGLTIVLMMFAIMWSMFYEKPEQKYTLTPKAKTPKKAKGPTLAKKAGKAAKLAKPSGKKAKAVSKKAITKKASAKNKAQPKITSRVDSAVDETNAMLRSDSTKIQTPDGIQVSACWSSGDYLKDYGGRMLWCFYQTRRPLLSSKF